MKVEIWSDISCPYCFISKRRFELALAELDFAADVDVIWRSFELDPNAEKQYQQSKVEHLAEKYDQPQKWAELLCLSLTEQGSELGIQFDFDNNKVTNTFDAHRLLQYAKTENKENELKESLLSACFEKSALLADHESLLACAEQVGLNKQQANEVLSSDDYSQQVREDQTMAQEIGIESVPFFIIDEAYGMEGAQPVEHIKKMLTDVYSGQI